MSVKQKQIEIHQKLDEIQSVVEDRLNEGIDDNIDIVEELIELQRDWCLSIENKLEEMSDHFRQQLQEMSKYADRLRGIETDDSQSE